MVLVAGIAEKYVQRMEKNKKNIFRRNKRENCLNKRLKDKIKQLV